MQDLNDLYFFVQAVEKQGFTAASRALGVPKSSLSRRAMDHAVDPVASRSLALGPRFCRLSRAEFPKVVAA
jgi:regulatory helix-turn-helix LysR family protein